MSPVLYSPNEPEHFLGFFTSWIRIRIQEAYLYADSCGFMRIHADSCGSGALNFLLVAVAGAAK